METDDLDGTCVSITKTMDLLANKCQAKFKWMVVDACRNDPTKGAKGIGGKGLQIIPKPPAGIALFQSCAEGEESWEDRDSGNGYFTKNFAAALSGEADANHDGNLTLMEVCTWTTAHTKEQVKSSQNKTQRPYFSGSVSDFTLTEDLNVRKAQELAAEAQKAVEAENYELAVKKYDEAIALCPRFDSWKRERNMAQKLLKRPTVAGGNVQPATATPSPVQTTSETPIASPQGPTLFKFDVNNDGVVTKDELPGNNKFIERMFENTDANKDGKVTKEEEAAHKAELQKRYEQRHKK